MPSPDDKDLKIQRQKFQMTKKGFEDIVRAIENRESTSVHKVEIKGAEIVTIKGDKGDKGNTPSEEELVPIIEKLIPAPIKGDKGDPLTWKDLTKEQKESLKGLQGDDYKLTNKDKADIAKAIKVPVVDRIIEKTETIVEKPIVTEVAKYETAEQQAEKLAKYKKAWLPIDSVDGLRGELNRTKGGGGSANSLKALIDVDYSGLTQDANGNFILGSGGGGSLALETNGTPNGSQTLLNLAEGDGIVLNDNGTGTVTISSGITFQTDGNPNSSQILLNLIAGTGITLTDGGSGEITIDATGGGSSPFALENTTSIFSTPAFPITSTSTNSFFALTNAGDGTSTAHLIAIGNGAGQNATGANNSIFLGQESGQNASGAGHGVFLGTASGNGATNAAFSNFFGNGAGGSATNASNSNFIGTGAGQGATNALNSSFLGAGAGGGAVNAASSIFIGNNAGASDTVNNTSSGTSILIGDNSSTGGFKNSIAIGAGATNTAVNEFLIDDSYTRYNFRGVPYIMPSTGGAVGDILAITNDTSSIYTLDWQSPGTASPFALENVNSIFSTPAFPITSTSTHSFFALDSAGNNTAVSQSNMIGFGAGSAATNASDSNFLGAFAGQVATNASFSNFFGYTAGQLATNATLSNFFGSGAGQGATNAANSIFIGTGAGGSDTVDNVTNPDNWSILFGQFTGTGGFSNSILLGGGTSATPIANTKTNQFMLADSITDVRWRGIEYEFPSAQATASGDVLSNDGTGVLSWVPAGGSATIYTGDGTISGSRTVEMGGNDLNFADSASGNKAGLYIDTAGLRSALGAAHTSGLTSLYVDNNTNTVVVEAGSLQIPAGATAGYVLTSDATGIASWQVAGGATYTFSTGLTDTAGTITNNLSTGISGGQSAIGGTAAGNDLTLSSTSNATKGNIFFGTASTYDEVNDRFGITQTTPLSKLHINRDDIRVTQSDAYGITLQNATASVVTSGQDVQYSPAVVLRGTEWLTTTGASHTLDYRFFNRPVSGTTAARGGFLIQQSLNGAAYTDMFEVGQTISNSAGYNIRLNNATVFALGGGVVQFYGSSSGMGFYNSTGSVQFAGLDANGRWALTPSSLTTAATINTWNLTQTWNNASGVYTAHRIAITNTNSASTSRIVDYLIGGTSVFSIDTAGGTHLGEGANLIFGTTTGTKIGTATSQKLSLWNATPDVQPTTGITAAAFVTNTSGILNDTATFGGYTIGQIVAALQRIGALA